MQAYERMAVYMAELLDLVDEHDNVIGTERRDRIYQMGLHNYRVVGVFLMDRKKRVLLPTRSMQCSYCPGCFDFSAAGHVHSGETYLQAVKRELSEELGINTDNIELHEFLYVKYPNRYGLSSFSKYYYAFYLGGMRKQVGEVSGLQWVPSERIQQLVKTKPEHFKSDFPPVFKEFMNTIICNPCIEKETTIGGNSL